MNEYLENLGKKAVKAKFFLQTLSAEQKNMAINHAADCLIADQDIILQANKDEVARAKANGMHPGLLDRLMLNSERIIAIAEGLRDITKLDDPVGECMESFVRPNGMKISKIRVPMGVIGIIYESRPNVTADAFGLCFKAGNAVILKGGSDALETNQSITDSIRRSLSESVSIPDCIQLIASTDRAVTNEFMKCSHFVNVLIPRGGSGLIRAVVENSTIPVIETGIGNCHIYVDEFANLTMAAAIITNAKTQRIGVCNACESLVLHESIEEQFLPLLADALKVYHVELRGDSSVTSLLPEAKEATEEDYAKEFLDYILSVKTVRNIEEAIAHINQYSTGHSESIITDNQINAEKFLQCIDSACVYHNVSTRFTDGYEFGFGAEIGISTQKLHARGPMGLKELTSYKYTIEGNGQIR